MTSPLTINTRTILDLIDKHDLPACLISTGVGGPHSVDIDVTLDDDLRPWITHLEVEPVLDENGRRHLRLERDGLYLHVSSRQVAPTFEAVL